MLKIIVDIICVIVEIGLLRYIYKTFFPKCRVNRVEEFLFYLVLVVLAFLISHFKISAEQRLLYVLFLDIAPSVLYLDKWFVKFFAGTLFFAVQISCELFAWAFLAVITGDVADSLDGHAITNYIQGIFLSKSLATAILYFISGLSKGNEYRGKKILLCLYMLFPIIITLCLNQVAYATDLLQSEKSHAKFLLITFFMIVINIAFFYLFDKQMQTEKIRWEYQMVSLRERMQEQYYEVLIKRDLEVSKMYHDMKHHILYLKYQVDENNWDVVRDYLESLSDHFEVNKVHFTNQTTINAILNIKNEQAKKKKITLEIVVPKDFILVKVTDMDLVIILANCLDNAIEAVEKIKQFDLQKIKIVILSDETGILIMIENPILEKLNLNRLETTKNEKEKHGFGIKNIKSIVEKYEGNFQIEVENQLFRVKIFLPN